MSQPKGPSPLDELMTRMGVKGRHKFDPLPPDHLDAFVKSPDPYYRLLGALYLATISGKDRRKRCEYAISDEGDELHIEQLADRAKVERSLARRLWTEGVRDGVWRNGNDKEGKRKLYLCGTVAPKEAPAAPLSSIGEKVCADYFDPCIWKQIKGWPPEKIEQFARVEALEEKVENQLRADFDAARRAFITQRQNSRYQQWGVKKIRETHEPQSLTRAGEYAARQERVATVLLPALEPLFATLADQAVTTLLASDLEFADITEESAQTIVESAHTSENGLRKAEKNGREDSLSLLPQTIPEKTRGRAAAGSSDGNGGHLKPHAQDGEMHAKYLHTGKDDDSPSEPQTPAENAGLEILFSEIARMQQSYKHTDFSREIVKRERKSDRVTLLKILRKIGPTNALAFLAECANRFRGLDRNSLAKLPPRSPADPHGPRSLGLILTWATHWSEQQQRVQSAHGGE